MVSFFLEHHVLHSTSFDSQTDFSLQEAWNREMTAPRFSAKQQKKKLLGMYKQRILWKSRSCIRSERLVHIEKVSKIALEEFFCGCTCLALVLIGFGERSMKHRSEWQFATWWRRMLYKSKSLTSGVCPVTFHFWKVFHGHFAWWILLINPKKSDSVPPGVPS